MVEHPALNRQVEGSSPSGITYLHIMSEKYPVKPYTLDDLKIALRIDPSIDSSEEQAYAAYASVLPKLMQGLDSGYYCWIDQDELGSKRVQTRLNKNIRFSLIQHYMYGIPCSPQLVGYYTIGSALVVIEIDTNFSVPENLELGCGLSLTSSPLDEDYSPEDAIEYETDWYLYGLDVDTSDIPAFVLRALTDAGNSTVDLERTTNDLNNLKTLYREENTEFSEDNLIWAKDYQVIFPFLGEGGA